MRRFLHAAAATLALVSAVSCSDDAAGPRAPQVGSLAVVPNFGTLQGGIVEVARARFVLTRIPGGAVAKDTVIDIAANQDSVDLGLTVTILTPGETFNLTIALISPAGDTVFQGGPVVVTPGTSDTPVAVDVPFTYVGTGADAAGVRIVSPDPSTLTGDLVLLTAEAFGDDLLAIPGTPIGWTSLDTAVVAVTTDAQYRGVAVGGLQRGVARLVATLVTGQTDTALVSNQPVPTAIVAESGSGQSALADSTLPQPLVALVTAGDGLGVAGLWVRFAVASGGGALSADSVLTDADGRAAVQYTLERTFQTPTVTATTARLGSQTATFTATLVFAPPATLEIVNGDGQSAVAGTAVAVAPEVRVLDADGLPVPGVTVTFAITGGGGIVAGGTPVTDTMGLAAITSWTLGTTAGPNGLEASVNGLNGAFTATGLAGAASQLELVSGDAQSGTVGAALALPLVVRAEDANGNPVAGATVDWVAGAGGVSAGATVTDGDGLAQVTWTLGTTPGAQGTTATLNGTTATVDFTATATAGAAARLEFTVQPTDVQQGAIITPAVAVTAYDDFDNVAIGFTGTVTVALLANPGNATLGGTPAAAAVAGITTFADLQVSASGNGYTLLATATGIDADTSITFDVLPPAGQAYWINAAGGNWSNPANWQAGGVPAETDTVFITLEGTYTVAVDAAVTVAELVMGGTTGTQTLAVSSAPISVSGDAAIGATAAITHVGPSVFTIDGNLTLAGGHQTTNATLAVGGTVEIASTASVTLDDAALTGTGPVTNAGSVTVNPGPTTLGGALNNAASGTIILIGNNGGAGLTVAAGFTNAGALAISGGFGSNLTVTGGVLVNTGTLTTSGTAGHVLAAALDNQGTVDIQGSGALTLNAASAAHVNTGLVQLTGGNLLVTQTGTSPSFAHSGGQLIVPSARTLTITGGAFAYQAGTLEGLGTLALTGNVAVDVTPAYQNDTLAVTMTDVTVTGTGALTNTGTWTLQRTTIANAFTNSSTLTVNPGVSALNGAFANGVTNTLALIGNNGGADLTVAAGFTNAGTISIVGGFGSFLRVPAGTLVNTGTLTTSGTAGHVLAAALDNQGTVDIQGSGALTLNAGSAAHVNTGLVQLTGGNLLVTQTGTSPSFAHSGGQLIVPSGRTLTVSGGAFAYQAGTLEGLGTLALTGNVAVDVTPAYQNDTLTVTMTDVTVTGAGALTNTGTWTLQRTTIANAFTNSSTLTVNPGVSALNGAFANGVTNTLALVGNNGGADLTVATGFPNAGTISIVGGFGSFLRVPSGTLVNTGTLTTSGTAGHVLAAALDNQGTLDIQGSGALTLNAASAAHVNTGLVQLTGGNLLVTQTGTSPSFAHSGGQLIVPSARTLTITGGAFAYQAGTLEGLGTLALTGNVAVDVTPAYQNDTLAVSMTDATVTGTGALTNTGTWTLQRTTIANAFTNSATLTVSPGVSALNGAFSNAAAGTMTLLGNNGGADLTVATGFTNAGAIAVTGGFGSFLRVPTGALVNTGTLTTSGTAGHVLAAALDNQGTLDVQGSGALTLNVASAAHVNTGLVQLTGGNLTVSQSGTTPSFTHGGGQLIVPSGRILTVSGGAFDYQAGTLEGLGTLALSGNVAVAVTPAYQNDTLAVSMTDATVTGTGVLTNTGTWTLQRTTIANAFTNSATLTVSPGVSALNGAFSNAAAGTMTLLGNNGGADLTVATGFTNAGAIAVTGGFGSFLRVPTGALVNTGTLTTSGTAGHVLAAALDNQGTLDVQGSGALTLNAVSAAHSNTGVVAVTGGNLTVTQSGTSPSFTNQDSIVVSAGRTLTVTGGTFSNETDFETFAGLIAGDGTVNVSGTTFTNDAFVAPGLSPGILTFSGDYGQGLNGSTVIELGGTAPGTEHDQLVVTGTATLSGIVDATTLLPAYTPAAGDRLAIVVAGQVAGVPSVTLPDVSGQGLLAAFELVDAVAPTRDTLYVTFSTAVAGPGINTWVTTAGLWSTDANWSLGRAPIPGDTVQLTQGVDYQVTLDVSATVAKLAIGGTGDVISLAVGDQTLTISDAGGDPGLDILPLGSIEVGNGGIVAERISNQGSVRFAGTSATLGTGTVANAGAWRVVGGQLTVNGEGAFDFQTSGLLRLETGATLIVDGGFLTYLGGTVEAGLGTGNALVFINGGEFGLQADLALDSLVVVLANGRIQYFTGTERLTIGPDAGITMDGTTLAEVTAIVENQGVIVANTGTANFFNDSLYNAATGAIAVNATGAAVGLGIAGTENLGIVSLSGDQAATLSVSGGGGGLTNRAGASLITSGTGAHVFDGVLINESGAAVTVGSAFTVQRTAAFGTQHVNGGTIDVAVGNLTVALTGSGASFTNQGSLSVTGGNVTVSTSGTSLVFTNEGTIAVESPRSFSVSNSSGGAFTNAAAGVLQGTGTFNLTGGSPTVSNLGTIGPGLSAGVLTWQGNLPMGATSAIAIELGGTTVGTEYDQLSASGYQLSLDGVLNVSLINEFEPAAGDSFAIMLGVRSGQFTAVNLPTVPGITLDTGSTLTTFYVTAATTAPPGTEAIWTGASSATWGDPGNWDTNQVPDDTTNVFIPAGTPQDPILAANALAETLIVADGATLTVNSPFTLTISGSLTAGTTILGTGVVVMTGTDQTLSGTVPNLDIQGRTLLSGPTTTTGYVDLSFGALLLNGYSFQVGGDFRPGGSFQDTVNLNFGPPDGISSVVTVAGDWSPFNAYALSMHEGLDSVIVQGNAGLYSPMATDTAFTGGVLMFQGGVDEDGEGLLADINGTATLVFASALPVTFYLAQTDLPFPNVLVMGDSVRVGYSQMNLLGNLTIAGNAVFDPGGSTVTVSGDLVTQESGRLRMATFGNDDLTVLSNVTFGGGSTTGGLTGGILTVGGDFTQTSATSTTSFAASGTHQVSLTGSGIVSFASPGAAASQFQNLSLGGVASTTFSSTSVVAGTLSLSDGSLASIASGSILDVNGGLTQSAGAAIEGEGTLDLTDATVRSLGGIVRPGTSPGILTIAGGATASASTTLTIELSGTTAGTGYDQLNAAGASLTLDGTLDVQLSGFTPTEGDQFTVLTLGTRTGDFQTVNLPDLTGQGLTWDRTFGPTNMVLSVVAPPPSILFAGDSAGNSLNSGIFRVDSDGTNQIHLTTEGPPAETEVYPRWSPDRTRITYSARALRADPNQVHVRTADGSTVWHLVADTSAYRPRYSPDGVHLAFECGDGGFPNSAQDVCVIADVRNPFDGMGDGTGKVYVTDAVSADLGGSGAFAWNPQDADQLAVVRDSVIAGGPLASQIWLVRYDGATTTPLGTKVILDGAGAPVRVISMDWSPDGSFIVFEGLSGSTSSIFRIDVSTATVTQLTSQNLDHRPVISPDGSEILFGRENDLWVLSKIGADGSGLTSLSPNMSFDIADAGWDWSPDGSEIVVTEGVTTSGVVISKVPRTTNPTSFFSDASAGKLGRRGGSEIQDRQPSWRP